MKAAGRVCAQAGRVVIMEPAILLLPREGIAVAIPTIVDTAEEHQVLMILIVKVIMAEVVIINVKLMDIQIVMICRQVVEPPEVPRSSSIAPTSPATPSATAPSSVVSSRSRRDEMVRHCHSASP